VQSLQIPATVQAILATRIDWLAAEDKTPADRLGDRQGRAVGDPDGDRGTPRGGTTAGAWGLAGGGVSIRDASTLTRLSPSSSGLAGSTSPNSPKPSIPTQSGRGIDCHGGRAEAPPATRNLSQVSPEDPPHERRPALVAPYRVVRRGPRDPGRQLSRRLHGAGARAAPAWPRLTSGLHGRLERDHRDPATKLANVSRMLHRSLTRHAVEREGYVSSADHAADEASSRHARRPEPPARLPRTPEARPTSAPA